MKKTLLILFSLVLLNFAAFGGSATLIVSFQLDYVNHSTNAYLSINAGGDCPRAQWNSVGNGGRTVTANLEIPGSGTWTWTDSTYVGLNLSAGDSVSFYAGIEGDLVLVGQYTMTVSEGNEYVSMNKIIDVDGSSCSLWIAPPCTTNLVFDYKNGNTYYSIFAVGRNFNGAIEPEPGSIQTVPPGGTYHFSWNGPCDKASEMHLLTSPLGADGLVDTGMGGHGTNSIPPYVGTNSVSPPPTNNISSDTNTFMTPTPTMGQPQSNILWSAASSSTDLSGVIAAIKDAASVAHDDAVKIGGQAHEDAQGIKSGLTNIHVSVTNNFSGTFTNNFNLTNYATESTLAGMSNALFGGSYETNDFGSDFLTNAVQEVTDMQVTNFGWEIQFETNQSVIDSMTKGVAGMGESETYMDGFKEGIYNFADSMDDFYPAVAMTFELDYGSGTKVINFDPLTYVAPDGSMPGVALFDLARKLFMWLLVLFYLMKITEDAMKVIMLLENARGANPAALKAAIKDLNQT